jgi:hypothetical protein
MKKYFVPLFLIIYSFCECKSQNKDDLKPIQKHSFAIQGGLALLETPYVLYPSINLSYSKTIAGLKRHRLAILFQSGAIFIPDIETKFLFSVSAQYNYVSKKRFEANVFFGLNNQIRMLSYDRYEFDGNTLQNKGRFLYQPGPTIGMNIGYKVIKRERFSITPFVGISLTKLNKDYQKKIFTGYKPNVSFGITLNK